MEAHHTCTCSHFPSSKKNTLLALILNASISILEFIGGLFSGSVAILSDAFNNAADAIALVITYFVLDKMEETPSLSKTFGGKRWEIIAALAKACFLIMTGIFIVYQSIFHFLHPEAINTWLVLSLAGIALSVNLASVFLLQKGAKQDLNIHSTNLCMIYDAAASLAVIISACMGLIWTSAANYFDLAASMIIVVFMLRSGIDVMKQSLHILLQNTPKEIDVPMILDEIRSVPGVINVSDLHVWTLSSGLHHLSCSVILSEYEYCRCAHIITEIKERIRKFHIRHVTIQPEYTDHGQPLLCPQHSLG